MNIAGYNFQGTYDPYRGFVNKIAAVYAIVDDQQKLIDVSHTDDLNNRFPNHPRQNCWGRNKNGDLHPYILHVADERIRLQIESLIRNQYNPSCGYR